MPSSQRRTTSKPRVVREPREVLEDLEPKPERKVNSSTKDLPVSKIVVDTLTDRISYTASYAISTEMLRTVGPNVSITPVEAYNLVYPSTRIIAYYLPGTIIKTSLPPEVADNCEKILITALTYITRIASGWFKARFDKQAVKSGIRQPDKPSRNGAIPVQPNYPDQEEVVQGPIEGEEIFGVVNMPVNDRPADGQVMPGVTGFDFEVLKADGAIAPDMGLVF